VILFHLLLMVLAVFFSWETLKEILPVKLPSLAHSGLVLALAFGWSFVPVWWLTLAGVTSAVGILHLLVGTTDDLKPGLSLPRRNPSRRTRSRVPDLPHGRGGG